jgi:hypothetical protein
MTQGREIILASLREAVLEAAKLLERHGDRHVSERMRTIAAALSSGSADGIQSALAESTGSMGSLRDRFLCPENGDDIAPEAVDVVNARLVSLVIEIRNQARTAASVSGSPR